LFVFQDVLYVVQGDSGLLGDFCRGVGVVDGDGVLDHSKIEIILDEADIAKVPGGIADDDSAAFEAVTDFAVHAHNSLRIWST
jgi:hypothetical protein